MGLDEVLTSGLEEAVLEGEGEFVDDEHIEAALEAVAGGVKEAVEVAEALCCEVAVMVAEKVTTASVTVGTVVGVDVVVLWMLAEVVAVPLLVAELSPVAVPATDRVCTTVTSAVMVGVRVTMAVLEDVGEAVTEGVLDTCAVELATTLGVAVGVPQLLGVAKGEAVPLTVGVIDTSAVPVRVADVE